MKELKRREPMKNAVQAGERPFAKASNATVLAAGLALAGAAAVAPLAGCDLRPQPLAANSSNCPQEDHVPAETEATANSQIRTGSLMFGSTVLVDANGAPVSKVIIGSISSPTEARAAALIVQKLAASTYKSFSLKAQLVGSATCSVVPVGGKCSVDMDRVIPVIMPYATKSVIVTEPYAYSYGELLVQDSEAAGVSTMVSVGRAEENSVTKSLLMGSAIDWDANPVLVKEVVQGSKIVVAGATPEDTLAAARAFVSQLRQD